MCTMQYSNNYANFRQNEFSSIHRRLVQVTSLPRRVYCRRGTSTYECCTKPSVVSQTAHPQKLPATIRQIPFSGLCIGEKSIGKGVFGKCYSGFMSSHLQVCMKVFQIDDLVSVFPMEATLTSRLCHSNLPWLYGITEHGPRKMLVLSFHGIDDKSCTLHKVLNYDSEQLWFDRSLIDWKVIMIYFLQLTISTKTESCITI